MAAMARVFASRRAYEAAQRAARLGRGRWPARRCAPWTRSRELPEVPGQASGTGGASSHPQPARARSREEGGPRGPERARGHPRARARGAARRAGRRGDRAARLRAPRRPPAATPSRASPSASRTTARPCATAERRSPRPSRSVCAEHGARRLVVPTGLPAAGGRRASSGRGRRPRARGARRPRRRRSRAARWPSRRPGRSSSTAASARAAARSRCVPDLHLCLVERSQVVGDRARRHPRARRRGAAPFTFVSGPSAPRATSSSTASRASTGRGGSRCCSSSVPGPGSCARP